MRGRLRWLLIGLTFAVMAVGATGCDVITGLIGGGGAVTIGEAFSAGPFEAVVTGVRVVPRIDGFYPEIDTPAEGWALAVITVELRNTSDAAAEPPSQLQAGIVTSADPDIQLVLPVPTNGPYDYHDLLGVGTVPAGEAVSATLIAPVKTDAVLQEVVFRAWVGDEDDIVVDLGDLPVEVEEPVIATVGEPIEVNGLKITVHEAGFPSEYTYKSGIMSGSFTPEGGGQYVEVEFTLENVSNPEPHDVGARNATGSFGGGGPAASARVYADGEPYFPENLIGLFKGVAYPSPYWTATEIEPVATGASGRAHLVFIVPGDAQELLFEYHEPTLGPSPRVRLK